ncbi:DUF4410 domain-containing protein [bacterium]|nr:DUF4410 domain-containing protein [bacterium]MBU1985060.1 DUF4410 domain-containing protein [bacterium]
MQGFLGRRNSVFGLVLVISVLVVGCAAPNRYAMKSPATADVRSFRSVEVVSVSTGITEDELDPGTPTELRMAIISAIQKARTYRQVAAELDSSAGVLQIRAKIVRFDRGSQAARYLVGFGAGKARLHVDCEFVDKESESIVAVGTFIAEIAGGLFGGTSNQGTMSKNVAKQVARFLKKGK